MCKGKYAVFFGRFIPIVRSLVSIPAGMAKMAFLPFIILTTVGSLIWNTVLINLGRFAGASWNKIADFISGYSDIVLGVFIVIAVLGIITIYAKKTSLIKIIKIGKNNKETER